MSLYIVLGDLSIQARDTSDLFYQHQVEGSMVYDGLEKNLLDGKAYLEGFTDSSEEIAMIEDLPNVDMHPIELEAGNQEVKIIYRDAGKVPARYEVIVYLLIEEE